MAKFELKLPKMGESVAEATITSWLKEVGDTIEADDSVVEIATDKVDSDVPSEVSGKLIKILFEKNDVVKVGQTLAIIEMEGELDESIVVEDIPEEEVIAAVVEEVEQQVEKTIEATSNGSIQNIANTDRFYSPLVKNMAATEGVNQDELDRIPGTGIDGRLTKADMLLYLKTRSKNAADPALKVVNSSSKIVPVEKEPIPLSVNGEDELIELSRMGKMISDHMIHSVQKSAHVQSFIEVDVTNLVAWRNNSKESFQKREGDKLTYTPVFMMAVAAAVKKYPLVNLSFDGDKKVVIKKNINLGMAAALGDGNLIVPVIQNADELNLIGMAKIVNDLAQRAKENKIRTNIVRRAKLKNLFIL